MNQFGNYQELCNELLESGSAIVLFETNDELATNTLTMQEFLELYDVPEDSVLLDDGTYVELVVDGKVFEVHASGNGDFRSHKIEIEQQ